MPDPASDLQAAFQKLSSDPRFIDLGYQDQYQLYGKMAQKVMSQYPQYTQLSPDEQSMLVQKAALRTPALKDKTLESYVDTAVGKARQGDPTAMSVVSGLANANSMGRSSVFGSLIGKMYGAINVAPGAPTSLMPLGSIGGAQQKSLMDGDDAAKLSAYFGTLGTRDPVFSKNSDYTKYIKESSAIGSIVDFSALMAVPGSTAASGVGSALKGATFAGRLAANTARLVLPAVANTAVGAVANIARQNALAALQKDPTLYTDTFQKLYETGGAGAVQNFALSLGLGAMGEYILPGAKALLKGPALDKSLSPKGVLFWKTAVDMPSLDRAIAMQGGTGVLPQEIIQTLPPVVRDTTWLRNFRMEAAARDPSTLDLRPLDRAALGVPADIAFAPEDWANPTGGKFNIYEFTQDKVGKGNPTYVNVGKAENLGDLQSKLADMVAARYASIEDLSKPASMQFSNALIKQGNLQAANASAYDPFPEVSKGGFTKPSLRGYLSPTEAQDAAYAAVANGGQAYRVKVDATPDMMKRIAANKSFLVDGAPLTLTPTTPDEANVLAIITKPADANALAAANEFAQRAAKENAGFSVAEAQKYYLVQNGYDGYIDPQTGAVTTFFPSRMKWVTDQFDVSTGRLLPDTAKRVAESSPLGAKVAIQGKIESSIGKESLASSPEALANVAMAKFKGSLQTPDVQNFVNQLSDAKGIPRSGITVRAVKGTTDALSDRAIVEVAKNPDGSIVVTVPERITSFAAQKGFVSDLISGVDKLGGEAKGTGYTPIAGPKLEKAIATAPSRFTLPFDNEAANETWLNSIAKSEYSGGSLSRTSDGSYALQDATGKVLGSFKDIYEARDAMLAASLDDRFLRGDLYRQGYKLSGNKTDGYRVAGPGLAKPVEGTSLQDVLKQIDYKPQAISNRLAPTDVQITPDSTIATFDGHTMMASKKAIAATLGKFEDPDELAKMVGVFHRNEGDAFRLADDMIRVNVPHLGVTRYFQNLDEAKAFLAEDMASLKFMKGAAGRKGLSLYYDNTTGGFQLGDGEKIMQAKDNAEVQKILASYPDAPGAREILSALDPQADDAVKAVIAQVDPKVMKDWRATNYDRTTVRYDAGALSELPREGSRGAKGLQEAGALRAAMRDQFATYDYYTESTVNKELGLHELGSRRNAVGRAARACDVDTDAAKRTNMALFTDEHGRPLKPERGAAITAYREAQANPEILDRVKAQFGDLSSRESDIVGRLKTLTDNYFNKFGVDFSTYQNGYMPHLRKYTMENWGEASTTVSAQDLLEKAYHGLDNVPKKLGAFFRNARASDVITAAMEDDPLKLLNHYVEVGNREKYLRQPIQDTIDYLNANAKNIPPDVIEHTMYDMESVAGRHQIAGMKGFQDVMGATANGIRKELGLHMVKPLAPDAGAKMLRAYNNLMYLGKVGARPWLAARNVLQILPTLGSRVGIQPALDALQEILGPEGASHLQRYRTQGITLRDAPTITQLGQDKLSQVTRKSMSMIYSADDIARGTAARAAENLLDDGIRSWGAGKLKGDIQKFKDLTELRQIQVGNPELADQIAQLAISGDSAKVAQAKALFAQKLSSETNPNFDSFQQPHFYTNTIAGNLFGRMGTYSTATRENLFRGWSAAKGIGGKALFVGRYVGISAGIAGGLAALGINGVDFLPGYSTLFGGGPQFSDALNIAMSASGNVSGATARKALEQEFLPSTYDEKTGILNPNLPKFLPGSLQVHYAGLFLDALERGDLWGAFLAGTSTPALK